MRRTLMRTWLAILSAGLCAAAHGQVVIYRCTDASGALTIQNDKPCPKGSKQQKRVVGAAPVGGLPPIFATTPARATTTPPTQRAQASAQPVQAAPDADASRLPPPALYECRTYDNGRYLSDDGQPPPRCAPLRVTGLGGAGNGAGAEGAACEMVQDQCQRIADGALCENWRQRLREAESQLRFGVVEQRDKAQAEVERMQRIVHESTCGH